MRGHSQRCSFGDCERFAQGRGLCIVHYKRAWRAMTLPSVWTRQDHVTKSMRVAGPSRYRRLEETIAKLGVQTANLQLELAEAREEASQQRIRAEAAEEQIALLQAQEAAV